jgi:YD repeat-containing protein
MSAFMRRTTTLCLSILLGLVAMSLQAQTAQFLWEDSNTQGAWLSVYGNDGYNVISSSAQYQNYPPYATVTPIGQTEYTWGTNLSVPSGLVEPGVQPPNNRIAAQWYSNTIFTLDINITDGQTHQVALYCLDYGDTNGRSQSIAVVNAQTGAVLDSRTENMFTSGQYLVWNVSGHVQIQMIRLAAYNATVSGIFFDPVSRPTITGLSQQSGATSGAVTIFGYNFGASGTLAFNGTNATPTQWSNNSITAPVPTGATSGPVTVTAGGKLSNNTDTFTVLSGQTLKFLGENGSTEGTWQGLYGADGYNVISATTQYQNYPAYATVTPTGQTEYTWGANVSDIRGLQEPGVLPPNNRIAAIWDSSTSLTLDVNLTDGLTHQVAVYCLDWDNQGRVQTVSILNAQNQSVLDSHTVSSFVNGVYLVWNLSGHIQIQFTNLAGPNAGLSGIFFGPSGTATPTIWGASQNAGQIGNSVTIIGTTFGASGTLTFNGTAATPTQWTNASITAPVPTGATTGNIVVTSGSVGSNGVGFTVTPSLGSLVPPSGPLSTVVQINGTGFGTAQGSTAFVFDGIAQTPGLWSSTQITSQLPSALVSGPVYIVVGGSNPGVFTLVGTGGISGTVTNLANGAALSGATVSLYLNSILQSTTTTATAGGYSFSNLATGTYSLTFSASGFSTASIASVPSDAGGNTVENIALSSPQITALSPSSGPVGTVVTVAGSNFGALQGASIVTFGVIGATVTQWSGTAITVTVPSGATTGSVTVTVGGATSNTSTFTVGTGTLQGTVTGTGGTGVVGATVNALQSGVVKASATSGSGGTYSIGSLAPGKYDMDASASGYGTQAVSAISVSANSGTTENFALTTPGTISGTITQSNGTTAISGAAVSVSSGYTVVGTATTNGSGAYSVAALGAGTYSVTASSPGFDTTSKTGQAVTAGGTTTTNISLAGQAAISYAYDEAGRLATVVDSLNNSALYTYDAAGNIQAITRKVATAVTVAEFVPNNGPVGTTVNIYGSGYSSTPSQNTVTFNGTTATVTSATTTQIVTTVPPGATTGKIKVTAPTGNATSTASFTVTTSNGLPTITSFSPSIASPGTTSVTINGTNFDPTASHDTLSVNVNKTYASAATSTALTTTVPGVVTSGHITVTTTVGSVSSSGYLFIPPPGYTTSQVGFTGQATLGGQVVATLGTASQIALVAVDMAGGQWLSVGTVSTFTSNVPYTVYDPYGNVLASGNIGNGTSSFDTIRAVTVTGTCTIMLAPGNATGSVTLSPMADVIDPITVGGSPVVVPPTSPGQSGHLTFYATAGMRVLLNIYNPTGAKDLNGNQGSNIKMLDPNGATVVGSFGGGNPGSTWYYYSGLLTLQVTGTYTIDFTPNGLSTWGATFQVGSVPPDLYANITVSPAAGPPAPVTIATQYPGQSVHLSFTGSPNQRLYMLAYTPTGTKDQFNNQGSGIWLRDPSNNQILYWGGGNPGTTWYGNSGLLTLNSTGTYTINFTPNGLSLWGATFQLVTIPGDINGSITVSPAAGPPAPVTISTQYAGQSVHLSFTGSPNQRLYMTAYTPTGTKDQFNNQGSGIWLRDPWNNQVLYWGGGNPGTTWYGYSGLITLSASGTYTINFTANGLSTWGATFQLVTIPADITSSITVSPATGPPAPVSISTQYAGQSVHLSFTGSPNQRLYMTAYTPTGTVDQFGNQGSGIWLRDPSNNQVLYWGGGNPGTSWYGYSGLITLSASGTYTINFTANGLSTWGATFQLVTIPADITSPITVSPAAGPPAPVSISTQYAGQSVHLSFTGSPNQRLYMTAYTPTGTKDQYNNQGSGIWLRDPSNNQVLYWGGGNPGTTWYGYSGLITLSASGTYTINFTANGLSTWGATFQLVTIPTDVTTNISLNTPVALSTAYAGESGHLNFANTVQNQQVYLYIYNPTGTIDQYGNQGSGIWFRDPSNNQILYWGGGNPGTSWFGCSSVTTLQTIGTYTINFTPNGLSLWGATFELMTTPCP